MQIPLSITSELPVGEHFHPASLGIPFPRGHLQSATGFEIEGRDRRPTPMHVRPLAHWPDGSIKWLLARYFTPPMAAGRAAQVVCRTERETDDGTSGSALVAKGDDSISVRAGDVNIRLDRSEVCRFRSISVHGQELLGPNGGRLRLADARGKSLAAQVDAIECEPADPHSTTIVISGHFVSEGEPRCQVRLSCFGSTGLVRLQVRVHNPRPAKHKGGIWDLGDAGSILFHGLGLDFDLFPVRNRQTFWKEHPCEEPRLLSGRRLELYQDSSGGQNWQSRNHVNRHGQPACRFQGCRIRTTDGERMVLRPSPTVFLTDGGWCMAASIAEFWQQFPKAITIDENRLRLDLFPPQCDDSHELQGGERKTHTVWMRFGATTEGWINWLDWTHAPPRAVLPAEWYATSRAISYIPAPVKTEAGLFGDMMQGAVCGPDSLLTRRETIDEYGWRNFGDIWANHEELHCPTAKPVISHYNNQFDIIYGAILRLMCSGDARWSDVLEPLARHVMDIDIYHTDGDKAAYNGGLFWHTDHYRDAATCTHRTYSRHNRPAGNRSYGGGPCAEHNYATGLLYYYYLTGDPDAHEAVLDLADWVIRMDDGRNNVLGVFDSGSTGLASSTRSTSYHGPGRGAGNSLNVLLDAWLASEEEVYFSKAEELIHRCVHPRDNVDALDLLDAESRWSYTVFLTALARYLDIKAERSEIDANYAYAQRTLVRYGLWMLEHERPYLDFPERLEYPTETWAAQELRKANVLRYAARHADAVSAARMRIRATELADRAWNDLHTFPSCSCTRPLALVMREGTVDACFRTGGIQPAPEAIGEYDFGEPQQFVPQKTRVFRRLRHARGLATMLLRCLNSAVWRGRA